MCSTLKSSKENERQRKRATNEEKKRKKGEGGWTFAPNFILLLKSLLRNETISQRQRNGQGNLY